MTKNYVALLGTKGGPAIRTGSSMPTSSLCVLDDKPVIVDCGLGVTRALVDQGLALKDLSLIFITHLHSDHYLELGPLLHTAWTAGLKTPVEIFGPVGLDLYLDSFLTSMKADIDLRIVDEGRPDLRPLIRFRSIEEGSILSQNGLEVSAIRTEHPPLIDCFALSFKTDKHHVVFSGDTAPIEAMTTFARDACLLVHEAMLEEALPALVERVGNGDNKLMKHLLRSHTPAESAAKIASKANVKALALFHLIPSDDPAFTQTHWHDAVDGFWSGPLFIGKDGMKIDLETL